MFWFYAYVVYPLNNLFKIKIKEIIYQVLIINAHGSVKNEKTASFYTNPQPYCNAPLTKKNDFKRW